MVAVNYRISSAVIAFEVFDEQRLQSLPAEETHTTQECDHEAHPGKEENSAI
jgi:hypothetical protein